MFSKESIKRFQVDVLYLDLRIFKRMYYYALSLNRRSCELSSNAACTHISHRQKFLLHTKSCIDLRVAIVGIDRRMLRIQIMRIQRSNRTMGCTELCVCPSEQKDTLEEMQRAPEALFFYIKTTKWCGKF